MAARRKRIGRGIYRDRYGMSAIVKVGTGDEARQREKRYPFDTPLKDIKAWQESMRAELRAALRRPAALSRGTLEADAQDVFGAGQAPDVLQVSGVRGGRVDGVVRAPPPNPDHIRARPQSAGDVDG